MPVGPWELAIVACILGVPMIAGIALLVVLLTRAGRGSAGGSSARTPLEILQERYARGEIDSEEYEERLRRITRESE